MTVMHKLRAITLRSKCHDH